MALHFGFNKSALGVVGVALAILAALALLRHAQSPAPYPELREIQQSWGFEEYQEHFVTLAEKKGAVYAFEVLRYADVPRTVDIHRVAHGIGYAHFEQEGLAGIHSCTTDFRNACEHAIVTQALITLGTQALHDVAKACSESPGGTNAYIHCFHGVGHGLAAYLGYDYESAVGMCKSVYDIALSLRPDVVGKRLWHECVGGATMELTQGEHDKDAWEKAKLTYMPEDDILMPCNADFVPNQVRPICYSYLKPRFLEAAGATRGVPSPEAYPEALSYCEKIPDDVFGSRDGCYAGFGAAFARFVTGDERTRGNVSEDSIAHVHELCGFAGSQDGQTACILAALDIIYWNTPSDVSTSIAYCTGAANPVLKVNCFSMLFSYGAYSFPATEDRSLFCTSFPDEYSDACMLAKPSASYVE